MTANLTLLVTKYLDVFVEGIWLTLLLSAITVLMGALVGSLICLCRMSKFKPISLLATAYVEIIRGTPLLLQLYFFYFLLPKLLGLELDQFTSIAVALVLNSSGYVSEIIRSGIQAVDKGQMEAARSLGLNPSQAMIKVILPQAVKNILPALANEFVMVIKETSLASTFFVGELMTQYRKLQGALYMTIEPLIIVGIIYFLLTFTLSKVIAMVERRMAVGD